jgi:phosphoribosylaminoimidazolecarboxamide formyltransferase / IMP cyclohydrolase
VHDRRVDAIANRFVYLWSTNGPAAAQAADDLKAEDVEFTVVSEAAPTDAMLADLRFAWRCVKHVKSNAITVAKGGRLLGMGSGQPNRVKSTQIALEKVRRRIVLTASAACVCSSCVC